MGDAALYMLNERRGDEKVNAESADCFDVVRVTKEACWPCDTGPRFQKSIHGTHRIQYRRVGGQYSVAQDKFIGNWAWFCYL